MLLASLFVAACVVSICIGTSVGTIVALVPVAAELAERTGIVLPLMVAAVVGGSFFGDNLSFISDTTVAATRTQGCSMNDKFKTNFKLVLPVAIVCFVIYAIMGVRGTSVEQVPLQEVHLWRILPYAAVLVTALLGVNVLLVLCLGILLTGIVGLFDGSYTLTNWIASMAKGVTGMGDVTYLVRGLTRRVHTSRGAECCISALVALTNCCTANNTVAILSVGSIAKDIAERYGVDKRRSASLLDIFSCVVQGIIPYGAQLLMASGLAVLSPIEIIPYLYYPMLLAVITVMSILLMKKNGKTSKK